MKISGIDFPKPLLNALRDGTLVVFAGAGVSMGKPACLPHFRALAMKIARGTSEDFDEHEPEDRFLGRLRYKGMDVHKLAAKVLSNKDPKPTDLHKNLLRLYSTPSSVRIVTTNFDTLFELAATCELGSGPEVFRVPALPLGGNFNGIVHVHGALDRPYEMVLTDADFGRAYLTEGWARRFLVDLFRSFTVLFVGYSHNDAVMNYLARALPVSETELRYALTEKASDDRWQRLGIKPISFPQAHAKDYSALDEGIKKLADYAARGILDWKNQVMDIAKNPPSLNEEEMDLIEDALSDAARTSFFTQVALPEEWIVWLDTRRLLDCLFVPSVSEVLGGGNDHLARWLAEKLARQNPERVFLLIAKHGMRLHPTFWWRLSRVIGENTDPPLAAGVLSRWVSVLLTTMPQLSVGDALGWLELYDLGERCSENGLTDLCIDIFEVMADNRLELSTPFSDLGFELKRLHVFVELQHVCDYATINDQWAKVLRPSLSKVAEPLLTRIIGIFEERHNIYRVWQDANSVGDPDSYHRDAIEPHEAETFLKPIDVLLDAARDCLKHLVTQQPEVAAPWCNRLVGAESPLLRRLAVHALSFREDLTVDEKLAWLLARNGLHDLSTENEAYGVLRSIYPHASPGQRLDVIKAVLAYPWPHQEDEDRESQAASVHFTWLSWLHDIHPECDFTRKALSNMVERFPDFQPREQLDTTRRGTNGWVEYSSPWNTDELLSKPAKGWTEELLSFQPDESYTPERSYLLREVENAATQDFRWGLDLANALQAGGQWDTDLWPPLMQAWSRELGVQEHRAVLGFLSRVELHQNHVGSIADALCAIVRDGGLSYASVLLKEANNIARTLRTLQDNDTTGQEVGDWLLHAFRSPTGKLTQFWLESLVIWRKQEDPRPESLSNEYREVLSEIIYNNSFTGRLAKTILAKESAYLLAADETWTKEYLIPLLGDDSNMDDYLAVWNGFLYGHKTLQLTELMKDAFLKAVTYFDTNFSGEKQRAWFIRDYLAMLRYTVKDPSKILNTWIPELFAKIGRGERVKFAESMTSHLKNMNEVEQQAWWESLLKHYWENRLQGVPVTLVLGEIKEMLSWLPHLKSVFPEAVDLAVVMPQQALGRSDVIYRINKSELWQSYPEAVAKLLIYLEGCNFPSWTWHFEGKELIGKLLESELADERTQELRELAARLGLT